MRRALNEAQAAVDYASYRFTRATDIRARLGMATLLVLLLHAWFLWLLITTHPTNWNLSQAEDIDDTVPVELWTEPPVEPLPPLEPVPQVEPQPRQAVESPPQVQPEPEPQPVQQEAAPAPAPVTKPAPVPQIVVPQMTTAPAVANSDMPVVDDTRTPTIGTKVKKKTAAQLAKRDEDSAVSLDDLNLHAPADVPALSTVEPSPLAPPAGSGASTTPPGQPGGRLGAMQGQGAPGTGTLGNGRGKLTQAMQGRDYCVAQQQAGKPIPAGCNMTDLASMPAIAGKRVAAYDAALAKKAYTAAPGNTEYWQRVDNVPVDPGRDDHMPKKGAYTNPKDQRVVGGCIDDSSCGVH